MTRAQQQCDPLTGSYKLCIVTLPPTASLATGALTVSRHLRTALIGHRPDLQALVPNGVAIGGLDTATGRQPYALASYDEVMSGNIFSARRNGAGFTCPFNTAAGEGSPAVAANRYIAFIRRAAGRRVLFVFDFKLQRMERLHGLDIGPDGFASGDAATRQAAHDARVRGNRGPARVTPTNPFLSAAR